VLEVGAGSGINLRYYDAAHVEKVCGIDPSIPLLDKANERAATLGFELELVRGSAEALPFDAASFDTAVMTYTLCSIPNAAAALAEIRRVLRRDGLFFVHPGLFYSDIGNHLGEFAFARETPYVHLKKSRAELERLVLASEPDRIDRSGEFATNEQYFQWFTELNPITIRAFEQEIRALGFEPWRVAIRCHDRVEYTKELQPYPMQDLAEGELYLSAYNRKPEAV